MAVDLRNIQISLTVSHPMRSPGNLRFPKLLLPLPLPSLFLIGVLCLMAGCQPTTANKLLGEWIGTPDTAHARAEREELRFGANQSATSPISQTSETGEAAQGKMTDWEQFDISIKFDFVSPERLNMSLADGSQPIVAEWSLLETTPTGCTIEVVAQAEYSSEEPVRRRFRLEFEQQNGSLNGFLLREVGADPQLGAMYFRPAKQ